MRLSITAVPCGSRAHRQVLTAFRPGGPTPAGVFELDGICQRGPGIWFDESLTSSQGPFSFHSLDSEKMRLGGVG